VVSIDVRQQPNASCTVPTDLPTRGPIGALPSFTVAPDAFDGIPPIPFDSRFLIPVNADGLHGRDLLLLDSSSSSPSGTTFVYLNDGTGHFSDGTAQVLGGASVTPNQPSSYDVADLNGDGRPDIFVSQQGVADGGAMSLLLLSGANGTLAETGASGISPNPSTSANKATAVADIDCDGDVDVFQSAIGAGATSRILVNDGSGALQADATRLPADLTNGVVSFTSAAACDIDRDGDPELILGGWNGSATKGDVLLLNDGFGHFRVAPDGSLPPWHFPAESNVTVSIRCADFDLDGYPDLVVSQTDSFTRGFVSVWHNQQNRTFTEVDPTGLDWPVGWISNVAAIDFNQDGWPDLSISGIGGDHRGRLYVNAGDGTFTEVTHPHDDEPLTPIDANGDGRPDLVAPGTAGAPTLLLNSAAPELPSGDTFSTVNVGDRLEVPLGPDSAASGHFHFEARGFVDHFTPTAAGNNKFIYFWLYSGNNFYYKGDGAGFLYIPYEYARTDYSCNYGKVKGRSNSPGEWPIEECYQTDAWQGDHWYSFDIDWDGANISITIDGELKNTGNYGSNVLPLIAGFGYPPADVEETGIQGMEFRNWSFSAH